MMMLHLPGDDKHPEVAFNGTSGRMRIMGRCIPENAQEFFDPLLSWIDALAGHPPSSLLLEIHLEYFNSSSVSPVASMVRKVNALREQGVEVVINWCYDEDDEDMMDSGTDIMDTFGVYMNLVAAPADNY